MDLSASILGKATATALQTRISTPILVIGSDSFTRAQLSRVECFNFIAAGNINRALADIGVKNTKDLFANYPPAVLALPRVGAVALAVIGAAFEAKQIGGDHPLEAWVSRHSEHGIRTFLTMKHQAQQEAVAELKEKKKRKAQRRNKAHQIRTERFLDRAADTQETA